MPQAPVVLTKIERVQPPVPEALLVCDMAPLVPFTRDRTDESVAEYIVDLAVAGEDCRTKLDEVRGILTREAVKP